MADGFPFSIGGYGTTVRVYERSPGVIYIAYQRGRERRRDRIGRVSPARARE